MAIFASSVNKLLQSARHGRINLGAFREALPRPADQLILDRASPWLDCWAESLNYDQHAKSRITDRKLLDVIGRCGHYPIRNGRAYHAGLMHTYGYLLSQLQTRYGYKHERWTDGKIEAGLGMPHGTLWPANSDCQPQSPPTLLQNVTYLFLRCIKAFGEETQQRCEADAEHVADAIRKYPYLQLKLTTLRETISILGGDEYQLLTRLVHFPHPLPSQSATSLEPVALLIYSARSGTRPHEQLITGFPIAQPDIDALLEPEQLGPYRAIPLRFNAFLPEFPREAFGMREVFDGV